VIRASPVLTGLRSTRHRPQPSACVEPARCTRRSRRPSRPCCPVHRPGATSMPRTRLASMPQPDGRPLSAHRFAAPHRPGRWLRSPAGQLRERSSRCRPCSSAAANLPLRPSPSCRRTGSRTRRAPAADGPVTRRPRRERTRRRDAAWTGRQAHRLIGRVSQNMNGNRGPLATGAGPPNQTHPIRPTVRPRRECSKRQATGLS
jgi:hypothetical protein